MIHLMSAAVMPAGNYGLYVYSPAKIGDLADVVHGAYGPYKSSIGYQQNGEIVHTYSTFVGEEGGQKPNELDEIRKRLDKLEMKVINRVMRPQIW